MITWLASYPRSGNTLLCTMLHDVFGVQTESAYNDTDVGADVAARIGYAKYTENQARDDTQRHFVKTHALPKDNFPAIYVVRDARCALMSYIHYLKAYNYPPHTVEEIISGAKLSAPSWSNHLSAWAEHSGLILRYKDMVANPDTVIARIAQFCCLKPLRAWRNPFKELQGLRPQFFRCASDEASLREFEALPRETRQLFWGLHGEWMHRLGYVKQIPLRLLIKYPSRSRPTQFLKTLELYRTMLSGKYETEFVVTADASDPTMNNAAMKEKLATLGVKYCVGSSQTKIQAINADMSGRYFDVLLLASDDMIPIVKNYDEIIMTLMFKHFRKFDGCLHFHDGRQDKLNTLSIMGHRLYERFGYIYHPAYFSLYCDNEFQAVTERWGKAVFVNQTIIKHDWLSCVDDLRRIGGSFCHRDMQTFERRRAAGFP